MKGGGGGIMSLLEGLTVCSHLAECSKRGGADAIHSEE